MAKKIVEVKKLCKNYGGVQALQNVSVSFESGKVHALLGENGAGKSTLIKILSGIETASSGDVIVNGEAVNIDSPITAHKLGISTVYQEPVQVMALSVAENIFTGRLPLNRWGLVDKVQLRRQTMELMERINIHLSPDMLLNELSIAQRQMVEILKAVSRKAKFIIFDEPTSSLTREETEMLFCTLRMLKADGATILYISHRLEEIFDLCDEVTILRDGRFIMQKSIAQLSQRDIISSMVGRSLENLYPKEMVKLGEEILRVEHISNASIRDVSFTLRRGEILGFCGLVGAGRTEVARAIFGIDRYNGSIMLDGKPYKAKKPWQAIRAGVALVPEDRKNQGFVHNLSVRVNMSAVSMKRNQRFSVIHTSEEKRQVQEMIDVLRIRTPSSQQSVDNLSGGNQQKVVFAKWLSEDPKLLILDEPTRGVDIGAKSEIYSIIEALAKRGIGIIMISSEMPELIAMADRILVMREGAVSGIIDRGNFSEDNLMKLALKGAEE